MYYYLQLMSPPSDTHDADIDLIPGTPKSDIVAFLYRNPGNRFSADNIREQLDIPHRMVSTTLTRLINGGLIGETGDRYYHALDHRDDLRHYVESLNQLKTMFDDKNYDEHINRDDPQLEDIDEQELTADLAELEAEFDKE
jgi:DNA-binding HxlR family transcriptional regulator